MCGYKLSDELCSMSGESISRIKKHKKPGGCLTSSEFSKCTPFVYKVIEPNDLICL